jgi:hypothetical protein
MLYTITFAFASQTNGDIHTLQYLILPPCIWCPISLVGLIVGYICNVRVNVGV